LGTQSDQYDTGTLQNLQPLAEQGWPPDPKMRSPAAANGRANRKSNFSKNNSIETEEFLQSETALAAAMRAALARKGVRP
jgi:hypothetical protein